MFQKMTQQQFMAAPIFGIHALDDVGSHGEVERLGRRTAPRAERTEQDQPGGHRAADLVGRGNPQTLHHPSDRTGATIKCCM